MANRYKVGCLALVLGANLLALGVVALVVAGYLHILLPEPERKELERTTSPDGAYDAVLLVVRGTGGATTGPSYELYVVEAGEEATDLPRPRFTNCTWQGSAGRLRTCQEEAADQPGSQMLLDTDHLRPGGYDGYEVRWQDERTLEFDHYKSGEALRFGCGHYPREWVRTDAGLSSTKMPDEVCAAGDASSGTAA